MKILILTLSLTLLFIVIFLVYIISKNNCEPYEITTYIKPELGIKSDKYLKNTLKSNKCNYFSVLHSDVLSLEDKQYIIENHINIENDSICDQYCQNIVIQQLYESLLIKKLLENYSITSKITIVYNKIFNAFKNKLNLENPNKYEEILMSWLKTIPYFPSNQKNRNWDMYNTNAIIQRLSGIDHDHTEILLGADFLKELGNYIPVEFKKIRNYSFNNILKRLRGYRTNQKHRRINNDKNSEYIKENQIGILNFNMDELKLSNKYYNPAPWKHPGRSECNINPLQGVYEHSAYKQDVPLECGLSGSVNFWIWTILYAEVNLTIEETLLVILSACIVLGADGGHSINEVLSSSTINAIFWKEYLKYSEDQKFSNYFQSEFAKNMYKITEKINPIGESKNFLEINTKEIGNNIYNNNCKKIEKDNYDDDDKNISEMNCHYLYLSDSKNLSVEEIKRREELESFFSKGRRDYPFAMYSIFLDQLPELNQIRQEVIKELLNYTIKNC